MLYTVYKTTNLVNGKFYIGKHKTHKPDDWYLGSGTLINKAIDKYGRENFKKEILFVFTTQKEMEDKEAELVNESFVNRSDTYNMTPGGRGGNAHFKGHTEETKRLIGFKNSKINRPRPEEELQRIRTHSIGKIRTDEHKEKYSNYAKKRIWIVNQEGDVRHCLDINDERLTSGAYIRGKVWH